MESKPYDVVLLPNATLNEKFIAMSESLNKLNTHFTLSDTVYFPHMSIYMLQMDDVGVAKAETLLESTSHEIKQIEATAKNFNYENEYLDVEYKRTEDLNHIQNKVIDLLNPVRNGLREKDKLRLATVLGVEKINIEKYGYRSVGETFFPHMTFTRFKTPQVNILNTLPPLAMFEGSFITLGLFEMGDNGTCIRKVKTWELS